MAARDNIDSILAGLVVQYRLVEPHRLAIGHTLAKLMAGEGGDPVRTAEQLTKLTAILAETKPVCGGLDLSRLNDQELALMHRLVAKAEGKSDEAIETLEIQFARPEAAYGNHGPGSPLQAQG